MSDIKKSGKCVLFVRLAPEQHARAKFAAGLSPKMSLSTFCREAIFEHTKKRLLEIEENTKKHLLELQEYTSQRRRFY